MSAYSLTSLASQLEHINRALAEPIAPPRRTKVRRLTKKEVDEIAGLRYAPRKPPRRITAEEVAEGRRRSDGVRRKISLGKDNARPSRVVRRKAATAVGAESTATGAAINPPVKLSELAKQAGVQEQLVRLWLRKAGIKRPGTRWQWAADSRELASVRKALQERLA